MVTISTADFKAFPGILDRVERGESIIITRDGKPVARLVPVEAGAGRPRRSAQEIIEGFRALRRGIRPARPGDLTIREMIEEGRKF